MWRRRRRREPSRQGCPRPVELVVADVAANARALGTRRPPRRARRPGGPTRAGRARACRRGFPGEGRPSAAWPASCRAPPPRGARAATRRGRAPPGAGSPSARRRRGCPRSGRSGRGGRRRTWRPKPGHARDAVGVVAHEGEPVGDGGGRHAELRHHPVLVHQEPAAAVQADDAAPAHALGEVLVGGADHDLLHARVVGPAGGGGGEGVVRLELDHGPDHEPQGLGGLLGERELGQSSSGTPSPVL